MNHLLSIVVALISTAVDGHFRGGKKITKEPTEVDLATLTEAQLDAIHQDKNIIRPVAWADAYFEAKARFSNTSQPVDPNVAIAELRTLLANREAQLRDLIAVEANRRAQMADCEAQLKAAEADFSAQLASANLRIAELEKPAGKVK